MRIKIFALSFIIVSFIFCGIGCVQPGHAPRGDGEDICQHEVRKDLERADRIVQHGIQTRQINPKEAKNIRHNFKNVENDLNRYVSDGRLSRKECDRLKSKIHSLYGHIKHDIRD